MSNDLAINRSQTTHRADAAQLRLVGREMRSGEDRRGGVDRRRMRLVADPRDRLVDRRGAD